MKRRVVITGLGVVSNIGCKVDEFWSRLLAGDSGISPITLFDTTDFRVTIGGEVPNWSTDGYLNTREVKRYDRFGQFGYVAGVDAVRDSGIDFSKEDPYRCGAIFGVGIGGLGEIESQHLRLLKKGPNKVSAMTIPKLMPNAPSGNISIEYGLRGINTVVATACASATNAIGDAMRAIMFNDTDVMVTGGAEAALTAVGLSAFASLRAVSERNDDPTRASRPFDVDRDGFVLGEGAGAMVIEELEHAKARGARIYAELCGYGASADGSHVTQPNEDGIGAVHAMNLAINSAGITPEDIDYVNAHGTSTPLGDIAETTSIKKVFGDHAYKLNVSSTKSQIGHLLGASGAVELIATTLSIRDNVIPATANLENPDPKCDLNYTAGSPCERPVRYALKNSFGFGGHNGCLVVGKFNE